MTPTAISQLIEAAGKLLLGVLFALFSLKRGYSLPAVSAFSVLGISLGSFLSLVYLAFARRIGLLGKRIGAEEAARENLRVSKGIGGRNLCLRLL